MTAGDLASYAAAAGFSGQDLITAVAVALAESGGDPSAYNPEGSYGLWQIYLAAHPEFQGLNLYDPATNAAAAFGVYSAAGGSFTPWTTYKTGAYVKYLAAAQNAIAGAPVVTMIPAAPAPSLDLSGIPVPVLATLAIVAGVLVFDQLF